jgi:hypothetical protein
MPRLGELLVASGLLTVEQVERALRAQVMWGGRLGTNLVELHVLELDPLSQAIGRQHTLPAALARHFEKADPELQRMLSPDFAERFSCVPLLRMGPEQHVVVASIAPLTPRQLAIIADELDVAPARIVPALAAELRIRYQLERVYNIRRAARYLRARGNSIPPFPQFPVLPLPSEPELELPSLPTSTREMAAFRLPGGPAPAAAEPIAPDEPDAAATDAAATDAWPAVPEDPGDEPADEPASGDALDTHDDLLPVEVIVPSRITEDLDYLEVTDARDAMRGGLSGAASPDQAGREAPPPIDEQTARERRQYVRTIADAPPAPDGPTPIGRIAIRKVAAGPAPRVVAGATLGEATRAIRRSTGRDRVAELVIDTLDRFAPACDAAIVLVIRGATAIGWKGFVRAGAPLGEIAVPMEDGGLVPRAVELNVTLRKPAAELARIDRLLLGSLGRHDGELLVVPISIADQVLCVIALAAALDAPITCAEPIAAAAGAAFARLMRDASR